MSLKPDQEQLPTAGGPRSEVRGHTLSRVVTLPEDLEQAGEADLVWVEDHSDHLRVSCHTCNTHTPEGSDC